MTALFKHSHSMDREKRWAILFLSLPALAGLLLFRFWPLLEAAWLGFHDYSLLSGSREWIGLGNYGRALNDTLFQSTLRTTALFFILKVPLQIVLGLGLALLVKRPGVRSSLLRTVVLIPTITTLIVVTTVWSMMYHPSIGLFNSFLQTFSLESQPFLKSAGQALPAITIMTIWRDVGFTMLFFLAGLLGIPSEYYEASVVDGANKWQQFFYITVPLLKRTTIFVILTETISAFKVFTPILIMTKGGPSNATRVIALFIYENAFNFNKMGYASALSVILFFLLLIISLVQLRTSRRGED